jgi:hypothetical protein
MIFQDLHDKNPVNPEKSCNPVPVILSKVFHAKNCPHHSGSLTPYRLRREGDH